MKRKLFNLITVLVLLSVAIFSFTACAHTHDYSAEWKSNETHHWHECKGDDCSDKSDYAEHAYDTEVGYSVSDGKAYTEKQCVCGKTQKTELTNYIIATPSTAQDVFDGKNGSLDNATVIFAQGEYNDTLYFGRPTIYEGSNTVYVGKQGETEITDLEEIKAMTWGSRYYSRSIKNVTIISVDGVILPAIETFSGHVYGDGVYDYVTEKEYNGSAYYMTHDIKNITFKGLTFSGRVNFETSDLATAIDGIKFEDCLFTLSGTDSAVGAAIRLYSENDQAAQIKNVTVDGCTINNVYQGVYVHHVQNVTVRNSTFDTTGHNAIAVQNHGETAFDHGTVLISDNVFKNVGDRIIRFNKFGGTSITITGNVATNSGDGDNEVIKATSLADGVIYTINGNDWGDGVVVNEQLKDA